MRQWLNYLVDAVRRPRAELTRRQHQLRYAWDLVVYCSRQLMFHRAEGMAAELTYRTIFSLIPVVVLGLVMFRVFGGLEQVQGRVENQLFSFFGVPEIPTAYLPKIDPKSTDDGDQLVVKVITDEDGESNLDGTDAVEGGADAENSDKAEADSDAVVSAEMEATSDSEQAEIDEAKTALKARASIRRSLHDVTAQIATLDFASIGVFGLLLFVYAAVALADSTEYLFNIIYDAPKARPVHIRVAIHWSIITLGSGLLALSLYMSGQVVDWAGDIGAGSRPLWLLQHLLSLMASWVLLFLLYALMPNTHVSVRAAGIGAAVGAGMWEFAKYGFQIYVSKAVPYSALYGSLGLIPLFLFWIYVTWLIVLFGLILTYTLQTMRGRRLRGRMLSREDVPGGDPDWMLPIMTEVAIAFASGNAIGRQDLSDRLGLSSRLVHDLENQLIDGGCLRRVSASAGEEDQLTLAKPADKISVSDVLSLAHQSRKMNDHPAWQTLADLKQAERDAAGNRTLADLLKTSR